MPARDPAQVVAEGERVLAQRAIHVAALVRDVLWPVLPACEGKRREAEAVHLARRAFDAQLPRDLARDEIALPLRLVVVVAGAELVHHRGRKDLRPPADNRSGIELRIEDRHVRQGIACLEGNAVRIAVLVAAPEEERVVLARLRVESEVATLPLTRL